MALLVAVVREKRGEFPLQSACAGHVHPGRDSGDPRSGRKETNAMAEETVYLELSEEDGGSHKFYELVVAGTQVRIRFGRIGDAGQTQTSDYATAALAQKFADKKDSRESQQRV